MGNLHRTLVGTNQKPLLFQQRLLGQFPSGLDGVDVSFQVDLVRQKPTDYFKELEPVFRSTGVQVEEILQDLRVPYGIIRPTLVFRYGDLLLNNMAWALRRFPVFPVFGNGDYTVKPIYAGDLAAQAVDAGSGSDSFVADAAGPETFTFEGLLRLLASSVDTRVRLVHTPPSLLFAMTRLVGVLLRDVVLTRDEVGGLKAGLLTSGSAPKGMTKPKPR